MDRMIGKCIRVGPGGLKCSCCGNSGPGKGRDFLRRKVKRSEKQKVRQAIRSGNY